MFFYKAKDGTLMYMGKDKYENEDLIKYGWPEDVWFHVDNLSSAHVYVRLAVGKTMADIPDEVVRDCAQLVKENSIDGSKKSSVTVIYTPWANLRKDGSMATGQVSFHNPADVRKYVVTERDKETLRRLEKTKEERYPDLPAERASRDEEEKAKLRAEGRARAKAEKELEEKRRKEKEDRSYDRLFGATKGAVAAAAAAGGKKGGKKRLGEGREDDTGLEGDMMGLGISGTGDATASRAYEDSFM